MATEEAPSPSRTMENVLGYESPVDGPFVQERTGELVGVLEVGAMVVCQKRPAESNLSICQNEHVPSCQERTSALEQHDEHSRKVEQR